MTCLPIECRITEGGELLIPATKKNGRHHANANVIDVDTGMDDTTEICVHDCRVADNFAGSVARQVLMDCTSLSCVFEDASEAN